MANNFIHASIGDFLKGLRRAMKSKDAKINLSGTTYWLTTKDKLDEAAREPDVYIEFIGLEYDGEGEDEKVYWTFLANSEGSGDQKRLAVEA